MSEMRASGMVSVRVFELGSMMVGLLSFTSLTMNVTLCGVDIFGSLFSIAFRVTVKISCCRASRSILFTLMTPVSSSMEKRSSSET